MVFRTSPVLSKMAQPQSVARCAVLIHVSNVHYLLPGPFRGCHETRPIEDLYAGWLHVRGLFLGSACPAKRMQRSPHR